MNKEGRPVIIGGHFYQPPRFAFHPHLSHISTDPEGKDWTAIIADQCYRPLAQEGTIEHFSFDLYQSLLIHLDKMDPDLARFYEKAMIEEGIGESFIHPILPDLTDNDRQIVIQAGITRYQEITGRHPRFFWPPETALDTPTLETLAASGYEGFICAPEQIYQVDGQSSDDRPTKIILPSGRSIIAMPFDTKISRELAFNGKQNADQFANELFRPRVSDLNNGRVLIAWTDAETFGHHYRDGHKFLKYLLETSLPNLGLYPVSINDFHFDLAYLPEGRLKERSAWSCPHENLNRWHGCCPCADQDPSWKWPLYSAHQRLNQTLDQIIIAQFGKLPTQEISRSFYQIYAHPENTDTPEKNLLAAKVSALVARTSCATFFSDPETSGKINLLYGYQTIQYLKDSGLHKQAEELSNQYYQDLQSTWYPRQKFTAFDSLTATLK